MLKKKRREQKKVFNRINYDLCALIYILELIFFYKVLLPFFVMDMDGQPAMSMYDLMEEEGLLPPNDGLVLLVIRKGQGIVRGDTGHSVELREVMKGGFFGIPNSWERYKLPYSRIQRIAERQKPREGADFYLPIFQRDMLSGIQYFRAG